MRPGNSPLRAFERAADGKEKEPNSTAVVTLLKQIEANRRNAKSTGPRTKEDCDAFAMQCR